MRRVSRKENIHIALVTICWQERLVLQYSNEFHKKGFAAIHKMSMFLSYAYISSCEPSFSQFLMNVCVYSSCISFIYSLWNPRSNMCLVGDWTVYKNSLESLMQIIFEPIMHAVYYTRSFKFLWKVVYDTLSYHTALEIDLLQVIAFFSFAHAFSLVLRLITIRDKLQCVTVRVD
jgi:hypothetical protein